MKHLLTTALLAILVFCSVSLNAQSRDIPNFSAISASTSVSVTLIKADAPAIEYRMIKGKDENLITEVKGNTLKIKTKSKNGWSWSSNAQAEVTVYYTQLSDINVAAGASLKASDPIYTEDMDIDVSSGASADIEVICTELSADASSGATIKLEGSSSKSSYDASSGASIRAKTLTSNKVRAEASSGASISLHADKSLNADASSGGSIKYAGNVSDTDIDAGWSGQIRRIR